MSEETSLSVQSLHAEVLPERALIPVEDRWLAPVMSLQQALDTRKDLMAFIGNLLIDGVDYGSLPGTEKKGEKKKDVLLKPGAEKLCSFFGLTPRFELVALAEDWTGAEHGGEPFFYYRYKCALWRGNRLCGEGEGSCNSWEVKYRYRQGDRICPQCGKAAIIRGKAEFERDKSYTATVQGQTVGPWMCFQKKGGCGTKFKPGDQAIEGQSTGRIRNEDPADGVNTYQKMAQKRSLLAPVLTTLGLSELFTQDVDDHVDSQAPSSPPPQPPPQQHESAGAATAVGYGEPTKDNTVQDVDDTDDTFAKQETADDLFKRICATLGGNKPKDFARDLSAHLAHGLGVTIDEIREQPEADRLQILKNAIWLGANAKPLIEANAKKFREQHPEPESLIPVAEEKQYRAAAKAAGRSDKFITGMVAYLNVDLKARRDGGASAREVIEEAKARITSEMAKMKLPYRLVAAPGPPLPREPGDDYVADDTDVPDNIGGQP